MQISRLDALRPNCIDDPLFLATLGGLLLEQGDAEQALIWLERSLLLDPDNLGTQADHALALAALGEPAALQELKQAWINRSDLPAPLRARLFPVDPTRPPVVKLGRSGLPVWGLQGEVSLLAGYENNLDQSPRLTELTLTAPEGNVVLPVIGRPRSGAALSASTALHGAYSPVPGDVWRTGISASARNTPTDRATDWTYLQWTASAAHKWSWLRTHLDLGVSWVGGPLNEPYRLHKAGFAVDVGAGSCRLQLGLDVEQRRQSQTFAYNAQASGVQLGVQCPLNGKSPSLFSLLVRRAEDRPDSDTRPGGLQHHLALGGRLSMPLAGLWQLDMSVRASSVHDAEGYSLLLENNAARRLRQQQLSIEWIRRSDPAFLGGAQGVLQLHVVRQSSNLALFEYKALSAYGGLRWEW